MTTTARVFTMPGLNPERLKELAEAGADLKLNFDALALPEPQYGETVVGELTEEETQLFIAYYDAQQRSEDLNRNTLGAILRRAGDSIAKSDRSKHLRHALENQMPEFEDEATEQDFFRQELLTAHLKAALFFTLAERLGNYKDRLGIRSKQRVVSAGRRLEGMIQAQQG